MVPKWVRPIKNGVKGSFSSFIFLEDSIDGISKNNPVFQSLRVRDSIEQNINSLQNRVEDQPVLVSSLYFAHPWIWNTRIPFHLKSSEIAKNLNYLQAQNVSFILSDFAHGSVIGWLKGSTITNRKRVVKLSIRRYP